MTTAISARAGRRRARAAEPFLLALATLLFWLVMAALILVLVGRGYEVLTPEQAWQVWLACGWGALVALVPAALLWARLIMRLRGRAPRLAGLLAVLAVLLLVATPFLATVELHQADEVRDMVAAEGRVGEHAFRYWPEDGTIGVAGGIGPGFADDLKTAMIQHPRFTRVVITSGGGMVSEAMTAARLLESRPDVTVVARWQCDSACVIILMSGRRRQALDGMSIGFHALAPILPKGDSLERRIMAAQRDRVEAYMERRGVPSSLLETAQRLGPARVYEVPAPALLNLGVLTDLVGEDLQPLPLAQ